MLTDQQLETIAKNHIKKETTVAKNYSFTNAQQMAATNPATFSAPSMADLQAVRPGGYVKVCAEAGGQGERCWVAVEDVRQTPAGPLFAGRIDNNLIYTKLHGLRCGDVVVVEPFQVYQVM